MSHVVRVVLNMDELMSHWEIGEQIFKMFLHVWRKSELKLMEIILSLLSLLKVSS